MLEQETNLSLAVAFVILIQWHMTEVALCMLLYLSSYAVFGCICMLHVLHISRNIAQISIQIINLFTLLHAF